METASFSETNCLKNCLYLITQVAEQLEITTVIEWPCSCYAMCTHMNIWGHSRTTLLNQLYLLCFILRLGALTTWTSLRRGKKASG